MKKREPARDLGDGVARLAHDAANDLLQVGSALALLAARARSPEAAEIAREADRALAGAAAGLREIVDLVRGGPVVADLRECLAGIAAEVAAALPPEPLALRLASAEQEILRKVLAEIVRSEGAGRLVASVERDAGRIILHLDSPAPPLDDAEIARRLAPERLRNPPSLGGGLSLGIGAAVFRRLGGELRLGDAPGGGRRYSIELPEVAPRPRVRPSPTPRTVLVVEDEPGVAQSLRILLESIGHRALVASRFDEAHRLLAEHAVDAMIVDLRLGPGGSGADLIAEIAERRPELLDALAISTGDPSTVRPDLARFPLLRKPFGRDDLRALLGGSDV